MAALVVALRRAGAERELLRAAARQFGKVINVCGLNSDLARTYVVANEIESYLGRFDQSFQTRMKAMKALEDTGVRFWELTNAPSRKRATAKAAKTQPPPPCERWRPLLQGQ